MNKMREKLRDGMAVRGVLTVRKPHGIIVRVGNELVGPHLLAKLCAAISGASPINKLTVYDMTNASVLPLFTVSSTQHSGTDAFADWLWVVPPGTGTGDWDDVYIQTPVPDTLSEFVGVFGTLGAKGATDTWLVTYTLYFVPLVMS